MREYGEPMDLEFARYLKESGVCGALGKDEKGANARVHAEYNGKKVSFESFFSSLEVDLTNDGLYLTRDIIFLDTLVHGWLGQI